MAPWSLVLQGVVFVVLLVVARGQESCARGWPVNVVVLGDPTYVRRGGFVYSLLNGGETSTEYERNGCFGVGSTVAFTLQDALPPGTLEDGLLDTADVFVIPSLAAAVLTTAAERQRVVNFVGRGGTLVVFGGDDREAKKEPYSVELLKALFDWSSLEATTTAVRHTAVAVLDDALGTVFQDGPAELPGVSAGGTIRLLRRASLPSAAQSIYTDAEDQTWLFQARVSKGYVVYAGGDLFAYRADWLTAVCLSMTASRVGCDRAGLPTAKPTVKPTTQVLQTMAPTYKPAATPTLKPTSDPSVKPTVKPTLKPIVKPTLKPGASSDDDDNDAPGTIPACGDSPAWSKKDDPGKTCSWAASLPGPRCLVKAGDASRAFEGCLEACGSCGKPCADSTTWAKAGEREKDCAWVRRSQNRCAVLGADGTMAYEHCRKSCHTCDIDACVPAAACANSGAWFKKGDPGKNCAWVAGLPGARCLVKDESAVYAFEECGASCGSCGEPCVDSASWFKASEPEKDCAWVKVLMSRCAATGDDGTTAYTACRQSCLTCDATICPLSTR